jgi:ABC-2 type transport system permease protein
MSTNTLLLNRVTTTGWRMGLRNMLAKEFGRWFRTRRWLVQAIILCAIADMILFTILYKTPGSEVNGLKETAVMIFVLFGGVGPALAACIVMQDALVGEKQAGTAAWVLSKPISRVAFVLSKLAAGSAGYLVSGIVIPGVVAYALFAGSSSGALPPGNFVAALGVSWINVIFFISLSLMLGSMVDGRGPVIGIPMMLLFLYQIILGIAPKLYYVGPWSLMIPLAEPGKAPPEQVSIASALLLGQPLPNLTPLYCTIGFSILFIAVALWRFQREEF